MRVVVPHGSIYEPLVSRAEKVCAEKKWTLERLPEAECTKRMLANSADIALLSPLGYGLGVGRVDYRIISDPCISLIDYTEVAGITFNEHASEINTVGSRTPAAFMSIIGSLLMREKFEANDTPIVFAENIDSVDCLITETDSVTAQHMAMDVGEEWFDLIELPLPLGMWVCRADLEEESGEWRRENGEGKMEDVLMQSGSGERQGRISYSWSEDVEAGLEAALRMMFFYQLLSELPAVKLLGRD